MAIRPIAIDGAGADGSAGSDQVIVPTAPPHRTARDKDAVRPV